jgi:hypothetical protein
MVICINISIPNFHTIMKTCSRCGETKELSCFSKRSGMVCNQSVKFAKPKCRQYYKPHEVARRKFKLTEDQYNDLMKNENCQICNVELTKKCIDHCHSTNKVRGVLCNNCNTALGLVGDNINTLQTMIEYLNYEKV